jgi:hypothetical protein
VDKLLGSYTNKKRRPQTLLMLKRVSMCAFPK